MGIVVIHWVLTCWQQRLPLFSFPPQKPNAVPVPQASCWVPKIKSIYKTLLLSTYHCLVYRLVFSPTKNKKNPHTSVIVPLGFAAVLHTQILSTQWWFLLSGGSLKGAGPQRHEGRIPPEWFCFCACKLDSWFWQQYLLCEN